MARKFGGALSYGYKPDPVGHVVTGFHVLRAANQLSTTVPTVIDWRPFVVSHGGPGVLDQKATGSCTGNSTSAAVCTRMAIMKTPIECPSPIGNYCYSRCLDRLPNPDGTFPPLTDDGAQPNQNMRALTEWGCPSKSEWGGYITDPTSTQLVPDPTHVNDEPTVRQDEAASAFLLDGYYRIDTIGNQRYRDIMTALAAGYPVCFAIDVDTAFEEYTGGVIGAPNQNDILGGHYIYAVGYTWDGVDPNSIVVIFANSWDVTWGENGFGRGNSAFIDNWTALYVMDVKQIPAPVAQAA